MSHDSRKTFVRASHDCTTVVRRSRHCLTTLSREIFVRASHDSRETFARVAHDVRANFDQFYLSQFSLEMVLFMSHICRIVQIAAAKGWRRVRDICDDSRRRFCVNFCRTKSITCLKLWRPVRDGFAMHVRISRYHANVSRINNRKPETVTFGLSVIHFCVYKPSHFVLGSVPGFSI